MAGASASQVDEKRKAAQNILEDAFKMVRDAEDEQADLR